MMKKVIMVVLLSLMTTSVNATTVKECEGFKNKADQIIQEDLVRSEYSEYSRYKVELSKMYIARYRACIEQLAYDLSLGR